MTDSGSSEVLLSRPNHDSDSPHSRAERARRVIQTFDRRPPQAEIYEAVTFPADHVVASERAIPLFDDELILSPGHIDPLYTAELIRKDELYKISQTSLREGLQRGFSQVIKVFDTVRTALRGDEEPVMVRTSKKPDAVVAKININSLLRRHELTFEDTQTLFMYMLKQEAGNTSLRGFVELSKKEYVYILKKLAKMKASPDVQHAEITRLRLEIENKVRRIIKKEIAFHKLLVLIAEEKPELMEIYNNTGTDTFYQETAREIRREVGSAPDKIDFEQFVKKVMDVIFPDSPVTPPQPRSV